MTAPVRVRVTVLFGALANETRIRMIELLESGPKTVGELARELGIQQSSASQHLAILTRTGVLRVVPTGAFRVYSLRGPRIPKILEIIEEFCEVHRIHELEGVDSSDDTTD